MGALTEVSAHSTASLSQHISCAITSPSCASHRAPYTSRWLLPRDWFTLSTIGHGCCLKGLKRHYHSFLTEALVPRKEHVRMCQGEGRHGTEGETGISQQCLSKSSSTGNSEISLPCASPLLVPSAPHSSRALGQQSGNSHCRCPSQEVSRDPLCRMPIFGSGSQPVINNMSVALQALMARDPILPPR